MKCSWKIQADFWKGNLATAHFPDLPCWNLEHKWNSDGPKWQRSALATRRIPVPRPNPGSSEEKREGRPRLSSACPLPAHCLAAVPSSTPQMLAVQWAVRKKTCSSCPSLAGGIHGCTDTIRHAASLDTLDTFGHIAASLLSLFCSLADLDILHRAPSAPLTLHLAWTSTLFLQPLTPTGPRNESPLRLVQPAATSCTTCRRGGRVCLPKSIVCLMQYRSLIVSQVGIAARCLGFTTRPQQRRSCQRKHP